MNNIHDPSQVPEHTKAGIQRYVEDRCPPGGFLYAVLRNDLLGAVALADDENLPKIPHIVAYLYNQPGIPMRCWGSPDAVHHWLHQDEEDE